MSTVQQAPYIFISYRRDDSAELTAKIRKHLIKVFGDKVGQDIHNITPGDDFRDAINYFVGNARVLVLIIGKNWLKELSKDRRGGIDWVRAEIETALSKKIHIVPLLVNGASELAPNDLPESLKPIAFLHTVRIGGFLSFSGDLNTLSKKIKHKVLTPKEQSRKKFGETINAIFGFIFIAFILVLVLSVALRH